MRYFLASILLLIASGARCDELPSASLYHLRTQLTNQAKEVRGLDVYQGQPVLIAMFYGSCPAVCPLLIESVRSVENALGASKKEVRVLLISVDPERDTPRTLAALAASRRIDTQRWSLMQPSAVDVRKIAAMLNVQYRKLPNGEFNHSSSITLLDRNGVPIATTTTLGNPDPEFLSVLRRAVPR